MNINESTKNLGELVKKPDLEDGNNQTPAIEKTSTSQSLRDTLSFMKKSKNFFKLVQDGKKVFWKKTPIIPQGENRVSIKGKEFDIKSNIQNSFTNTKLTNEKMEDEDKLTVYDILKNTRFFSMKHIKGLNSARKKDALYNLPQEIDEIRNPPLPAIENEADSLQGEGVEIIIPSNIIDIYTRLEILLGLKLSGHTDTLTETSNLVDEFYRRGEIQTKQQYRNALNKFQS